MFQIAYFSLHMRETVIFLLPVKNLTSPSCSPTPISYRMQEFWRFGHKYGPHCIFFIAHAQNGLISTSCQKSDVNIVFDDSDFHMMQEFWRFGHTYGSNCIFFIAHAQNGLISTSCQKSDVAIVFADPDFLFDKGILAILP